MNRSLGFVLPALVLLFATSRAEAHFPWLIVNESGKAALFFGENPADRTYKLPPPLAKAEVRQVAAGEASDPSAAKKIELAKVENENFVGLESSAAVSADSPLVSQVTYGLYQGARLDYYALHQPGALAKSADQPAAKTALDLDARLVDTDAGVYIIVTWKGKPLAGVEARLFCEEGHEEGTAKTDEQGKASFTDQQVEDGLNGILVGHTLADDKGEWNGKPYNSSSHYLTITFVKP